MDRLGGEGGPPVQSQGKIACSFAGFYWVSTLIDLQFEIAHTKSATDWSNPGTGTIVGGDGTVRCMVNPYCTPETSPPACNPSYVDQHPLIAGSYAQCSNFYNTLWLAEKSPSDVYWNCFPIPPGQNATGTADASPGVCTK